ncbi:MAG: bifunctional diaminohydroxyphosphoribosylaminopyrimidine deaminase/5-amino-6-(5-phosphoribosylamino)uracil reductase RibD [Proteobacteria bacterium]|nr:bifunctional diaminohydroxyphosphoribosylaminopyrimidine deaminase/5-amino-6-(5-phosphoribosylamino)uracil reductase RibD [Pseudomonadota bacterium]
MRMALTLAKRQLGMTAPNPSVGCLIVKDGVIVGRAATADTGRPHAETQALKIAGKDAKGATAYVTLEPCCHQGKTPPCTQALINAGVARVVIAVKDTDPRMQGKSISLLKKAGIAVTTGILEKEAHTLNEGFFSTIEKLRPFVTLKFATSLDGKIATRTGESKWITGETSRAYAHQLRANHDAIMVGIGTVLADNPTLTCRLPGMEHRSPVRVVADSKGRLPKDSALARTAKETPVWLLSTTQKLPSSAITLLHTQSKAGHVDLTHALALLAERGITRLLVEGGSTLAAALLKEGLVDSIVHFQAGITIGGDGLSAIGSIAAEHMRQTKRFHLASTRRLGEDTVTTYRLAN